MRRPRGDRADWEYADGPAVGEDVPLTSEPRDEESPGVPRAPAVQDAADGAATGREAPLEEREVRAEDPELSEATNARLTTELRETIGADRVRVPADRPRASRGERPSQGQGVGGYLGMHRFVLLRNAAILLTFAAIVALASGDWWILPLAAGIHALGTMTVVLTAIRMTTISEHPAPEVAAALAEEGVSSPDERFSEMVDEFRPAPAHGTGEVVSGGYNDRTVEAGSDPARAGAEQSTAWTATSGPTQPVEGGGAPDALMWAMSGSLVMISIIISAVIGGWMWLLTGVMLPLVVGWAVMQRQLRDRRGSGQALGARSLVAVAACTALAVAAFCAVVALAFQH
jgi:hypothetical protein